MRIDQPFNELSAARIRTIILNYKQYKDFNRLGLFRGLIESAHLSSEERTGLQQLARRTFARYFDFLVIKDPDTWWQTEYPDWVETSFGDRLNRWREIRERQQVIIERKGLGHRNFGVFSKHDCGRADCPLDGVMVKKNDPRRDNCRISFKSDPKTRKYGRWSGEDYKRRGKKVNWEIAAWEEE